MKHMINSMDPLFFYLNLIKHKIYQQYYMKKLIKICNFENLYDLLLKNSFKAIFLKKPPFDFSDIHVFLIREVPSLKLSWSQSLCFFFKF